MIDLRILGANGPLNQPYVAERPILARRPSKSDCPFIFIDEVCYQAIEFKLKIRPGDLPVEFSARGLTAVEVKPEDIALEPDDCSAFLEAKAKPKSAEGRNFRLTGFDIGRLRSLGRTLPGLSYLEVSMKPGRPVEVKLVYAPETLSISLENVDGVDLDFAVIEESFFVDAKAMASARSDFMRDNADALKLLEEV